MEIKVAIALTLLPLSVVLGVSVKSQQCLPANPTECGGRNLTDENITAAGSDEYGTVCSNTGVCNEQSTVMVHEVVYDCCAGFTVSTDDDSDQEQDTSHTGDTSHTHTKSDSSETSDSNEKSDSDERSDSSETSDSKHRRSTSIKSKSFSDSWKSSTTSKKASTKSSTYIPEGCPTVLAEDLMSCFDELELQQLAGLFDLFVDIDTSSTQLTVFAPTDEAIQTSIPNLNANTIEQAVNSLFVGSLQPSSSLMDGDTLPSLAGLSLHISLLKPAFSEKTRYFVNGAEMTSIDACKAPGVIVHVIDQIFPASSKSVIDVIASSSLQLMTMSTLLEASSMAKQLLTSCERVTLFAPTDQSLEDLKNQGILDCLKEEQNRVVLDAFLLQHMVASVEYNSTLFLRDSLKSKNCYSVSHQKCTTIDVSVYDDAIVLGEGSEIIEHDIPTATGVVHVISKPLSVINLRSICYPSSSITNTVDIVPSISSTSSISVVTNIITVTRTVVVTPSACPTQ